MNQDDKKLETDDTTDDAADDASDAATDNAADNVADAATDAATEDITEGLETVGDGPLYGQVDEDGAEVTDDEAVGEDAADAADEAAEDPVEILRADLDDAKDRLLRAMAETENLRRRAQREREDAAKYAISGFARDLLSVVDNLRRALDSLSDQHRGDESLAGLISGVENTERELLSAFERHGIRRVDPLGEKFDHNFHQAMFHLEASDQPAGTVVEVVQAGYVIADRLLRPALVGVSKAADQGADDAPTHIDTEA